MPGVLIGETVKAVMAAQDRRAAAVDAVRTVKTRALEEGLALSEALGRALNTSALDLWLESRR